MNVSIINANACKRIFDMHGKRFTDDAHDYLDTIMRQTISMLIRSAPPKRKYTRPTPAQSDTMADF